MRIHLMASLGLLATLISEGNPSLATETSNPIISFVLGDSIELLFGEDFDHDLSPGNSFDSSKLVEIIDDESAFQETEDQIPRTMAIAMQQYQASRNVSREVPLFDGKTLNGWTMLDGQPITRGWKVVDGMIRLDPKDREQHQRRVGHIVTLREFGDFQLSFEWKIFKGGNSGLKYRVRDYSGKIRGCEYQIIDDPNYHKPLSHRTRAGSIYDLYEPNQEKRLLPVGQFNTSRIVVWKNQIQHWLNGRLIVSATVGNQDWQDRVAGSKFSELKDFGQNRRGKIMLTDHGSEIWFRNIQFVTLPMDNEEPESTGP
jgi:hypothetical protein